MHVDEHISVCVSDQEGAVGGWLANGALRVGLWSEGGGALGREKMKMAL